MRIICGHQLGPDEERLIFDSGTSMERDGAVEEILNRIWVGAVENSLIVEDSKDVYTLVRHLLRTGILSIKPVLVLNWRDWCLWIVSSQGIFFPHYSRHLLRDR